MVAVKPESMASIPAFVWNRYCYCLLMTTTARTVKVWGWTISAPELFLLCCFEKVLILKFRKPNHDWEIQSRIYLFLAMTKRKALYPRLLHRTLSWKPTRCLNVAAAWLISEGKISHSSSSTLPKRLLVKSGSKDDTTVVLQRNETTKGIVFSSFVSLNWIFSHLQSRSAHQDIFQSIIPIQFLLEYIERRSTLHAFIHHGYQYRFRRRQWDYEHSPQTDQDCLYDRSGKLVGRRSFEASRQRHERCPVQLQSRWSRDAQGNSGPSPIRGRGEIENSS